MRCPAPDDISAKTPSELYARFVAVNSGGNRYPDREDPGQPRWWDGSQQHGYPAPGSPAGPSGPLSGGTGGRSPKTSSGWLIWCGAAAVTGLLLVITLVVAMHHSSASAPAAQSGQHTSAGGSTGSNLPLSQSQLCQSVVDPLYQHSLQGSGNGASAQAVNPFRQAARRASSDPALASDLNAVANDLQKEFNDMGSSSTATVRGDMTQVSNDMEALWQICPP
jgi:hypothetical protein